MKVLVGRRLAFDFFAQVHHSLRRPYDATVPGWLRLEDSIRFARAMATAHGRPKVTLLHTPSPEVATEMLADRVVSSLVNSPAHTMKALTTHTRGR